MKKNSSLVEKSKGKEGLENKQDCSTWRLGLSARMHISATMEEPQTVLAWPALLGYALADSIPIPVLIPVPVLDTFGTGGPINCPT